MSLSILFSPIIPIFHYSFFSIFCDLRVKFFVDADGSLAVGWIGKSIAGRGNPGLK